MIDIQHDQLLSFAEVAMRLPSSKKTGRRIHIASVHRWRQRGIGGIRLEAVRIGGCWVTTWPAVEAFVRSISANDGAPVRLEPSDADAACELLGY